jgi:hypothetical protein
MANKKIRGATSLVSDGISFKSKLEVVIYKELLRAGFNPKYEERKFVIWEGIKPTKPFYNRDIQTKMLKLDMGKMRDITYTPDFTFEYKNHLIIIEAKGFENDTFPIKKKLFRGLLEKMETSVIYLEVYTKKQLLQAIEILKAL